MIIDLDMSCKTILVIGSGRQAERRIESLLHEQCGRIIVAAANTDSAKISAWAADDRCPVEIYPQDVHDASFVAAHAPDVVVAATNDPKTNSMAVRAAQLHGILAYRADSAAESDYMHPSVIRLKGGITVAIFTGGQSPMVSKQIRKDAEAALRSVITTSTLGQLCIQDRVRQAAKSLVPSQEERKRILDEIMSDGTIDRLIRDGRLTDAQERAMSMLGDRT